MKKRLLSLVLCLVMVFTLLPMVEASVRAADANGTITNPDAVTDSTGALNLTKNLSYNTETGKYDITMESWATGEVNTTQITQQIPTDYVLIADQSGSMSTNDVPTGYDNGTTKNWKISDGANAYYYKVTDATGDHYYRVYRKYGDMFEYHARDTVYSGSCVRNLNWFQSETDQDLGKASEYYYNPSLDTSGSSVGSETDNRFYPVTVSAKGGVGYYGIRFRFTDINGTSIYLRWPDQPYYKSPTGGLFKPGDSWLLIRYDTCNRACKNLTGNDSTQYTFGKFLGINTGMYVRQVLFSRHVDYSQLAYKDDSGVEHYLINAKYCNSSGRPVGGSCDANGNPTGTYTSTTEAYWNGTLYSASGTTTRLNALKAAMNEFVNTVAAQENDDGTKPDHRVAIVGFAGGSSASNTELLTGTNFNITTSWGEKSGIQYQSLNLNYYKNALLDVTNDTQLTRLRSAIDALEADGGTEGQYGFYMAKNILDRRELTRFTTKGGEEVDRLTIVVYFTDGTPGNYENDNQYSYGNEVVDAAYQIKNSSTLQNTEIYSIGTFGFADAEPLVYEKYTGSNSEYKFDPDYVYTLSGTWSSGYMYRIWLRNTQGYGDVATDTVSDYMRTITTEFPNATKFVDASWYGSDIKSDSGVYTTMVNRVRGMSNGLRRYFLCTDLTGLSRVFTIIGSSETSSTSQVTLDERAQLVDVVHTTYFNTAGSTATAYTVAAYTDGTFGTSAVQTLTPSYDTETGEMTVSGFDYSDKYVSSIHAGEKLIVKISGLTPTEREENMPSNDGNAGIKATSIAENYALEIGSPTLTLEAVTPPAGDDSGMFLDKRLTGPAADGTYSITLEAYATGAYATSISTTETATDVVVVVDNSNSMTDPMGGGYTRFTKAAEAINSFVSDMAGRSVDHSIALVRAGQNSNTNKPFAYVGSQKTDILNAADGFSESVFQSAKNNQVAASLTTMENDNDSMNVSDTFSAVNKLLTDRRAKVGLRPTIVVFFSDGFPNGYNEEASYPYMQALKDAAKVFAIRVDTGTNSNRIKFMRSVSSSYPDAKWGGKAWDTGVKAPGAEYCRYINPEATEASFEGVFDGVMETIVTPSTTVKLDVNAYLEDVIAGNNFAFASDPVITVQTIACEANTGGDVNAKPGAQAQSFAPPSGFEPTQLPEGFTYNSATGTAYNSSTGAVRVYGFDYSDKYILYGHDGEMLIVTISGLVPKQAGDPLYSNESAGVYDKDGNLAIEKESPSTAVGTKTYVIDFNAKMTVATAVSKLGTITGTNGTFEKSGTNVTYQLKSTETLSGGANLTLSGVDTAMIFGKPANVTDATVVWNEITTIPANNIYFDDDLTNKIITVGDGIGYNAALESSDVYAENEGRWDNDDATQTYYFTFTGTGVDIYATTESDGAYVSAALFTDTEGAGAAACTTTNRVGGNATMKQYSEATRYNVPTLHFVGNGYGTYTVRIKALKSSFFRLDGIRIYNAVNDSSIYTENGAEQEANASFFNLRQLLVNDQTDFSYMTAGQTTDIDMEDLDNLISRVSGILYVDNAEGVLVIGRNEETGSLERLYASAFEAYVKNSPKNEIYLSKNQGIAFTIENYDTLKAANPNMQILVGLSVAKNGESSKVYFTNNTEEATAPYATVASPVDMYYPIEPATGSTFVIVNHDDAVVSITNLKVSGTNTKLTTSPASNAQVLAVSDDVAADTEELTTLQVVVNAKTLRALANIQPQSDVEPTDPGTPDEPEVTPEVTPDPTPEPTAPSIHSIIQQIVSYFVQNLFKSISRLFGN